MSKVYDDYIKNPNKCLHCGKPILPKEGQNISNVKQKKFCDLKCAGQYNRQKQINKEKTEYNKNPNKCLCCGKPILANNEQQLYDTKIKKFCDQSCAAIYNNTGNNKRIKHGKYVKGKKCLNCGNIINKGSAKYCSHNCQQDYKYKQYISDWKEGKESGLVGNRYVSGHIRKYLFDKNNNCCCKCGWNEINEITGKCPLQIHHIDGDYTNNSEENLELLCPNCHSLTNNYGVLNKGSGRDYRYKK